MRGVCIHIVNNMSAMIMERFDTIMFVSVLYITKSHHWTVRIAACGASLSGSSSTWSRRLSPVRPRRLMGSIDFRLPYGPMQIVFGGSNTADPGRAKAKDLEHDPLSVMTRAAVTLRPES
jgi:hypothetical protein